MGDDWFRDNSSASERLDASSGPKAARIKEVPLPGQGQGPSSLSTDTGTAQKKNAVALDAGIIARSFLDQSYDGIILVDHEGIILEYNKAQETITGIGREAAIGKPIWELLHAMAVEEDRARFSRDYLKVMVQSMISTGTQLPMNLKYQDKVIERPDGQRRMVQTAVFPIRTSEGFIMGSITRDVTDRRQAEDQLKASLQEKELLLKEVHHRVKNNLQIITSMLNLQLGSIENAETCSALKVCQERIKSMSLIHEGLYVSGNYKSIGFRDYAVKLVNNLLSAYNARQRNITASIDIPDLFLSIDQAIPCGLIINELVSNAFKHAFASADRGLVGISLHKKDGFYTLVISDDGAGLPPGLDIEKTKSLGLKIVTALVEQLNGTLAIESGDGTRFTITFPEK